MPYFSVSIRDSVDYDHIDADSEEEAINLALSWYEGRVPDINVTKEDE